MLWTPLFIYLYSQVFITRVIVLVQDSGFYYPTDAGSLLGLLLIQPIYDLRWHVKGPDLQTQSCRVSTT